MICLPIEEGGLSIQDLSEVQVSLLMKYAWKMVTGASIWTEFFKAKYVEKSHIATLVSSTRGSRLWKRVMRVLPHVLSNSRCLSF